MMNGKKMSMAEAYGKASKGKKKAVKKGKSSMAKMQKQEAMQQRGYKGSGGR